MTYLGYCRWCANVVEVVDRDDFFGRMCPECRADSPRSIDSLPDTLVASLVEEGKLELSDLDDRSIA